VVTAHAHKVAEQLQPPETKEDDVGLSHFAKVQSLRKQGYSIQEIAKIMNMDVKTVTGYIG
jgi:DNA-binding NarL/FixJ family response regulator